MQFDNSNPHSSYFSDLKQLSLWFEILLISEKSKFNTAAFNNLTMRLNNFKKSINTGEKNINCKLHESKIIHCLFLQSASLKETFLSAVADPIHFNKWALEVLPHL